MISTLYKILYRGEPAPSADTDQRAMQLAMAALLVEVAAADHSISESERHTIASVVRKKFSVTPEEAAEIAARAERDAGHVTSLYPFTRMIAAACSMEERIEIVGMLWQVTAADGCIDAHETHLVRKIAGLLYVPHSQFIRTRLRHEDC